MKREESFGKPGRTVLIVYSLSMFSLQESGVRRNPSITGVCSG
jgi:hypothetical protein